MLPVAPLFLTTVKVSLLTTPFGVVAVVVVVVAVVVVDVDDAVDAVVGAVVDRHCMLERRCLNSLFCR